MNRNLSEQFTAMTSIQYLFQIARRNRRVRATPQR